MIKYKHRANELFHPLEYKALELDVKVDNKELVLGHNPDEVKCLFADYLYNCNEETELAINIKQSGIIDLVVDLIRKYPVKSFFLFDLCFIDLLYGLKEYPEYTAFRWSNYQAENQNYPKAKFIWVDYIFDFSLNDIPLNFNKKFIVASPELHGSGYRYKNLIKNAYGLCTDDI